MAMTKEEKAGLKNSFLGKGTGAVGGAAVAESADTKLEKTIETALQGTSRGIYVVAKDGLVTLCGLSNSLQFKWDVAETIKSIPGVRAVTNHIRVALNKN